MPHLCLAEARLRAHTDLQFCIDELQIQKNSLQEHFIEKEVYLPDQLVNHIDNIVNLLQIISRDFQILFNTHGHNAFAKSHKVVREDLA